MWFPGKFVETVRPIRMSEKWFSKERGNPWLNPSSVSGVPRRDYYGKTDILVDI